MNKIAESKGCPAQIGERIENERERIFDAMGIVGMLEHAFEGGRPADMRATTDAWTAMRAAYKLLDDIAAKLNEISGV